LAGLLRRRAVILGVILFGLGGVTLLLAVILLRLRTVGLLFGLAVVAGEGLDVGCRLVVVGLSGRVLLWGGFLGDLLRWGRVVVDLELVPGGVKVARLRRVVIVGLGAGLVPLRGLV
jgi:hypothetical protein